jgi:hypothetical protein
MPIEQFQHFDQLFSALSKEDRYLIDGVFEAAFSDLQEERKQGNWVPANKQCNDESVCNACLLEKHSKDDGKVDNILSEAFDLIELLDDEPYNNGTVAFELSPQDAYIQFMANNAVLALYDDSEAYVENVCEFITNKNGFAKEL